MSSIKIKTLTVKNFMSVGNVSQAVDFGREQLTLVLGENLDQGGEDAGSRNGTGKSTIINALSFALYGQALTNIKKDNLINKINGKGMLVTLTFEKDGTEYRVERGRKPTIMKFFVNDTEQVETNDSQGDMRETQKDLSELVGMTHDMFKHVVALNTYTEPFLSLKSNEQREIIEQLLGITLLSEKAEALKEQAKLTRDAITQETANITAIKKANEKIEQSIATLETRKKAWNAQQKIDLEKLAESIVHLQEVNIEQELQHHAMLKSYTEKTSAIAALTKEKTTLEAALVQAERSLQKLRSDATTLRKKCCPTCSQELHSDTHEELLTKTTSSIKDAEEYLDSVSISLVSVLEDLSKLGDAGEKPTTFYKTVEEALTHQNNLSSLEALLETKAAETDPYDEQINELKSSALQEVCWDTVNELTALKDHQEFLLKLLTNKDSFVRKKIIDQNLSYLNTRLSHYLDSLGLPHTVVFQNDLSVEITQLGQDLDFDNLSRGERNRLILGLSWAFRDVWENLYHSMNLLFIDELIDNGLDAAGVESALKVLKKMGRERNKNVYLISHKDELVGRVNNVLMVTKENNFTSYSTDIEVTE